MSHWLTRILAAAAAIALLGLCIGLGISLGLRGSAPSLLPPAQAQVQSAHEIGVPQPLTEVVRQASPAVISVGAVKRAIVYDRHADFFAPFFARPRAIQQRTPYLGSGFLIDREGHVLTNFHVIEDAIEVFITLQDGRELPAEVLDADRFTDIALLRVDADPESLPTPIELGDSDALDIGETAIAFGNPFGNLIADPRPTVTVGVISALHRHFQPDRQNLRVYHDMIQTDAAINPGNSGGPLIDAWGRAVGINTFIVSRTGGSVGLGFAIPINRAKAMVAEIREHGRLRPLLVDFRAMTLNTPRVQGAVLAGIQDDGPAIAAGLEVGDVIVRADNRRISTREELMLVIASKQVGENITFEVWRGGESFTTTYDIREAPAQE